jgi:anti-sigma factor RsiW
MSPGHLSGIELTEYLDGEQSPAEAARTDRHLAACDRCRQALAELRQVVEVVETVAPVAPPSHLRARVAAELGAEPAPALACREAGPLLHGYVDGELPPVMVGAVQRHVHTCLRCRAELVLLTKVVGVVRSLRALAPPAAIRETVWAAQRMLPVPVGATSPRRARLRPALAMAAVAAAALLVVLVRPGSRPTEVAVRHPSNSAISEPVQPTSAAPGEEQTEPVSTAAASTSQETAGSTARGANLHRPEPAGGPGDTAGPPARYRRDSVVTFAHGPSAEPGRNALSSESRPASVTTASATPPAVLTLRAIAGAAGADSGGRRGMAAASDRFSTLAWETALATPPSGSSTAGSETTTGGTTAGEPREEPRRSSGSGDNRADSFSIRTPVV